MSLFLSSMHVVVEPRSAPTANDVLTTSIAVLFAMEPKMSTPAIQSVCNVWPPWGIGLTVAFWCIATPVASMAGSADTPPPNVLFIAIDDLRPALGCYGDTQAKTPNLDRLASRGMTFTRAYCQQAVCSPSRLSLLTGRRPDSTRVWDLKSHFRKALPDAVTLPQFFRQAGYHCFGIGKIFHGSGKPSKDPESWSVPPIYDVVRDPTLRYATQHNLSGDGLKRDSTEAAVVPDDAYVDGLVCQAAVKFLRDRHTNPEPFFLGIGFRKPHLPFCAPKRYWQYYDRDQIELPQHLSSPVDAPELATRSWQELEGYRDIPADGKLSNSQIRTLHHGYYACVSYVDALVGQILSELQLQRLADNTIVVVWGDHGFHLGEQGLWTKANNYELATRVPLIVALPPQRSTSTNQGTNSHPSGTCQQLVELVDVYPTLVDACGFKVPDGLEGTSMLPLIKDPTRQWKRAVFSQFPRNIQAHRHQSHGDVMGYAVRTEQFRYVEWLDWRSKQAVAVELYDLSSDEIEMTNVANAPKYDSVRQNHAEILKQGWQASRPVRQP